jgi:hypothetical protein
MQKVLISNLSKEDIGFKKAGGNVKSIGDKLYRM